MSKVLLASMFLILGFSAQTYGATVDGHVAYGGDAEDLELSLRFYDLLSTLKNAPEAISLAPQISRADSKKLIVVFKGRPNGLERYRSKKRVWVDYGTWSQRSSISRLHIVLMSTLEALTFDGPTDEVANKLLEIFLRKNTSPEAKALGAIYRCDNDELTRLFSGDPDFGSLSRSNLMGSAIEVLCAKALRPISDYRRYDEPIEILKDTYAQCIRERKTRLPSSEKQKFNLFIQTAAQLGFE